MICVCTIEACDNPMIPERHQCLLRLKMIHLLRGYGGSADRPWQVDRMVKPAYDPEVEGYLVYLQKGDDGSCLSDLGLEYGLTDLLFESVVFCEYSQCFDAILAADHGFTFHFVIPLNSIGEPSLRHLKSFIDLADTAIPVTQTTKGESVRLPDLQGRFVYA